MVKKWEPVSVLTKGKASSEVCSAYLSGKRLVVWLMWSWFFCSRWWTGWTNKTDSEKSLQGRSVRSTTHRYLLLLAIFVRSRLLLNAAKLQSGTKVFWRFCTHASRTLASPLTPHTMLKTIPCHFSRVSRLCCVRLAMWGTHSELIQTSVVKQW